jgi:hypothetical protein
MSRCKPSLPHLLNRRYCCTDNDNWGNNGEVRRIRHKRQHKEVQYYALTLKGFCRIVTPLIFNMGNAKP